MQVLERKLGDSIWVGRHIRIVVHEVRTGGRVRLGIEAPDSLTVLRDELRREDPGEGEFVADSVEGSPPPRSA